MRSNLQDLQPWLAPWAMYVFRFAQAYGCRITSVRRTHAEQASLYENYLLGYSQYPALPPGQSLHEYGRAWDMVGPAGVLEAIGNWWEQHGGRWGGRDGSDPIHFEA